MNTDGRVVVWFSCGAASAVAAKLAVTAHQDVHIVYCNTLASEHPDNARFLRDVSAWVGQPVEVITSRKYESVDEVFSKRRYMAGISGAPCTTEMKKIPRLDYQQPNDLHIFGLTADEQKRIDRFESNNPDLEVEWNLRDAGITKAGCYQILKDAGIALPAMYALGFANNNCLGCVKATSPIYWDRVRTHFPDVFERRTKQSREIGCRLTRMSGKRIFLDELPLLDPVADNTEPEEDIECGVICVKESA